MRPRRCSRPPLEIDRVLIACLNSTRSGLRLRELAHRAGCDPDTARRHLRRLERERNARRADTPDGPRWTAH